MRLKETKQYEHIRENNGDRGNINVDNTALLQKEMVDNENFSNFNAKSTRSGNTGGEKKSSNMRSRSTKAFGAKRPKAQTYNRHKRNSLLLFSHEDSKFISNFLTKIRFEK